MPDIGTVAYLIAIGYGLGVVWNTVLGRDQTNWMRTAAFPLLAIIIGQALWTTHLSSNAAQGLVFLGFNVYVALVSSFIGVVADVGATWMAKENTIRTAVRSFSHTLHLPR